MLLINRGLIEEALSLMLRPAQLEVFRGYRAQLSAIEDEHGSMFADLWSEGQLFIRSRGAVRQPPRGWDFVPSVIGLSHGVKPEFDPQQRSQWLEFWHWYLPMENHLTRLIGILQLLEAWKLHAKFRGELHGVALKILDQYQQWLRSERIAWLPLDRGGDRRRNIVERLGKCLLDCDTSSTGLVGDPLLAGEWR